MYSKYDIQLPQKTNARSSFILMFLADTALLKIKTQERRIKAALQDIDPAKLPILFGDLHFYFIAGTNLLKCLRMLDKQLPGDENFKQILATYTPLLKTIKDLRDHQEHILDGRLEGRGHKGKPLSEPNMLGNLFGDIYNFGGETLDIRESFTTLNKLKFDLQEWNKVSNVYPIWGTFG